MTSEDLLLQIYEENFKVKIPYNKSTAPKSTDIIVKIHDKLCYMLVNYDSSFINYRLYERVDPDKDIEDWKNHIPINFIRFCEIVRDFNILVLDLELEMKFAQEQIRLANMTRFEVRFSFDQIKTFDVNFRPKLNGVFYIEGYKKFYYKSIIKHHDLYLYKPKYVLHYNKDTKILPSNYEETPLTIYLFELLFNEKNVRKFVKRCLYTQEIIKITHDAE